MTAERDQLQATLQIQAEHSRIRALVIADQAREIEELKAALADEKDFSTALYKRLVKKGELAMEQEMKIAELEGQVDHCIDEAAACLELYYSAEAEVEQQYVKIAELKAEAEYYSTSPSSVSS